MKLEKFKSFSKKDLGQLRHLSYDDVKKIIDRMPFRMVAYVFANNCSQNQIAQIFDEYHLYCSDDRMAKQLGDPSVVKETYRDKILALVKALKKAHKSNLIPAVIRENYL